ncbi:MAG: DMT family transporter [Verrucomicrobiales bacterium]
MLAALLTTFFFALSAVSGHRLATRLGGIRGNFWRLVVAVTVLGLITAIAFRESLHWPTFRWYFLSGLVGFGLGDVALFLAYERIGSRLTILLNLCLAPLFAIATEWAWLGQIPGPWNAAAAAIILTGVGLAIWPRRRQPPHPAHHHHPHHGIRFAAGVFAALCAGFGQGVGAVISRRGELEAQLLGISVNGLSAAFQRVTAGVLFAALSFWFVSFLGQGLAKRNQKKEVSPVTLPPPIKGSLYRWLFAAALAGPVIGVSCFQWSLEILNSGIALTIIATTPIAMMPMAWWLEGDVPTRRSLCGAIIAVLGVGSMQLAHLDFWRKHPAESAPPAPTSTTP